MAIPHSRHLMTFQSRSLPRCQLLPPPLHCPLARLFFVMVILVRWPIGNRMIHEGLIGGKVESMFIVKGKVDLV